MKGIVGRLIVASFFLLVGILTAWSIHHSWMSPAPSISVNAAATLRDSESHILGPTGAVLWLLAVGVSQYSDPALRLKFADGDARSLAEAFAHQRNTPLYREVRSRVLVNEDATRENILDGMKAFVGQVGVDDIVVMFLAGHGVQERSSGSYYFLPAPASPANMLTSGLRISDVDEMVRVLRRAVRGVVVLLDTCHSGALPIPSTALSGDELVSRLSAAEGTFLLASSRAGEESREIPELGHGAFTYSLLEGLNGAADSNRDGLLPISELFGYVARRVPALTENLQHPYHKMEGTDLVIASVPSDAPALARANTQTMPLHSQLAVNSVGVLEFRNLRNDPHHDWVGKALRVAFNTELSKVRALRVYVPQLIDRAVVSNDSDDLRVARRLGIHTLISGSFHSVGDTLRIDAEIVDVETGVQKSSDSVEGNIDSFFQLQKNLVVSILRRLQVQISPEEGQSIEANTNTNVDAYRLLLETEGVVGEGASPTSPPAPPSPSEHSSLLRGLGWFVSTAYGLDVDDATRTAVTELLEEFREALNHKDLDRLALVYLNFSAKHRDALRAYFDNAQDLAVDIQDISIEPKDGGVLVSYTRRDRFIDRQSNKQVQLEARLAKLFVRENGTWKIAGAQ